MPHRGSRAKEAGSAVTGGATTGIFSAGADEAAHYGRKNEEIPGASAVQQQITALQGRVMEVTQKLQPVQDEACKVFEEIDGQGSQLDQVVATVEQCLEGPVTEQMIQELIEQEAQAKQQVEAARVKLEAFEAALSRPE
jgi:hypothetical protein